ncbi:hypothetical protein GTA51_18465 [Desulfovibrio aerotolerans]|uniref:Uncharacterized protein n=1 Tax=Solidesulfovibrio aerotolerans TaxID=295255 RepID=A0A7C9N7D3_9BACT|nr:hypothetical protein [Solidesulfovibrio aerotolerans]MYL85095.1 hypothetical protein [Solidesulfovibrio aerotolerans]
MLELYRRIFLALAIALGLWLFFLADLTPFYSVKTPKPVARAGSHAPGSLLPLPRRSEPPVIISVSGLQEEQFMAKAAAVSSGQDVDANWLRRVPPFERTWDRPREIYFKAPEFPLNALLPGPPDTSGPPLLFVDAAGHTLELRLTRLDDDSFHLGSGLTEYGPPLTMVFVWRPVAWWCLGLGLALYGLLPWRQFDATWRYIARWRVCLGDFGWAILFIAFFGLPMAIVGGSVQAVAAYPVFPCVLWPLAGLSLVGAWFAAWAAAFRLRLDPDGLTLGGLGPDLAIPFASIVAAYPVRHRYPRWFVRLLWIAAFFGRGASGLRSAGQAMLLESSAVSGIALTRSDGTTAYVWLTDAMGTMAVAGGQDLAKALRTAGVPLADAPQELVRLFPPLLVEGSESPAWPAWAVALLIALGPSVVVLLFNLLRILSS